MVSSLATVQTRESEFDVGFIDTATTASVLSLRTALQTQSDSTVMAVTQVLARRVEDIKHPEARACVGWLVGQYAGNLTGTTSRSPFAIEGIAEWAPDVLRIMAKRFTTEVSPDICACESVDQPLWH